MLASLLVMGMCRVIAHLRKIKVHMFTSTNHKVVWPLLPYTNRLSFTITDIVKDPAASVDAPKDW